MKKLLFLLLAIIIFCGCVPKTQLFVKQPAAINTEKIQTIAIGNFEIANIEQVFRSERNGLWTQHPVPLTKQQKDSISRAIRDKVVNLLTTTPYFQVQYTEEFAELENDAQLQQTISVKGYTVQDVDAVISGKVWISLQRTDASELAKVDLAYVQGGKKGVDVKVDRLVWWPYKSARGSMAMEIKMTRLDPTEVVAVDFDTRSYAHKIGGIPPGLLASLSDAAAQASDLLGSEEEEPSNKLQSDDEVLPSFPQMISDLATSIAASFVKKVAVTEKRVAYPIATGGDATGRMLLEAGAYNAAIEHLQKITNVSQPKADDLYNLGLCFEAKGDYGLAQTNYREAASQDPKNLLYAQGLGRIEQRQREFPHLQRQLANKP